MSRSWRIWLAFAVCLAVVLSALGWVSREVLRLDASEAQARCRAALEENVRLALWRMESVLTPLIARESARPYFTYTAFYPPDRAYGRMFNLPEDDNRLVASPLSRDPGEHVLLHFQYTPEGAIESPQAPNPSVRWMAPETDTTSLARAWEQLDALGLRVSREDLLARLPEEPDLARPIERSPQLAQQMKQSEQSMQTLRNDAEFQKRQRGYVVAQQQAQASNTMSIEPFSPDVHEGLFKPLWLNRTLLLVRRVDVGDQAYVQGCWLDWPAIRESLLGEIRDLLPEANLEPVPDGSTAAGERMLAALPIRLVAGALPAAVDAPVSPIRASLVVVWVCVLLAASAVAALLAGAVRLSERRGAFVSAVTHELRTPLTTFRMYTEMLAAGMVPDESKRRHYLETLRSEADRLSHLVQNVLSYARLERGRPGGQIETVAAADLLARIRDRVAERCAQAGMDLRIDIPAAGAPTPMRADATAVEQIVFNLVDNACKYAAGADDRRIHVETFAERDVVQIRVRDHGPGITAPEARRLFRPFSKSAQQAANSAPGIGLGLALCRRLARDMGGDLRYTRPASAGACFQLSLPRA